MKLGKGETTNPLNVISNLIAKDEERNYCTRFRFYI